MGSIHVHEFISLDGVIDTPTWTAGYGFVPEMGRVIGAVTEVAAAFGYDIETHIGGLR